jgi:uncharacterized membrane protein YgcG
MRKSTLFISAALTAFMLAVLFGVVSAYQNVVGSSQPQTAQQAPASEVAQVPAINPAQVPIQAPTQAPALVQPASITPEQATTIASAAIGRTDLYSVELTQLDGVDVYLVTFSSGDLVYIGLDGQVVSISKLATTVVTLPGGGGGGRGGGKGSSGGGGEHEGEHEGGDD